MPKLSALKLIDEAILPLVLVVCSKIFASFILTILLGISWVLTNQTSSGYNLYFLSFSNQEDLYLINTFSDLVMILVSAIGFVWVLFRANFFGQSRLHPIFAAKLYKKGREHMIMSDHEVYHQAAIWLTLSWFTLFTIINNVALGSSSEFNLGVGLVITITLNLTLWERLRKLKH